MTKNNFTANDARKLMESSAEMERLLEKAIEAIKVAAHARQTHTWITDLQNPFDREYIKKQLVSLGYTVKEYDSKTLEVRWAN